MDEIRFWLYRPRWFREVEQFIVAGTGVLDDMGVGPSGAPYDVLKWCTAARWGGAKVVFMSVGAGPIHNLLSRSLMLSALKVGHYRSYRDRVSQAYLHGIGFHRVTDQVYPDLVFSLPLPDVIKPRAICVPPQTVGVGVMGYYGWNYSKRGETIYETYVAKLRRFVCWLLDAGLSIRLLTGQSSGDQRPAVELLNFVNAAHNPAWQDCVTLNKITDVTDLLAEINQTDVVVATRYHNVVCALMLGRPVISLGYAKKNDFLLADMGLQAYCQHVESFSVERLIEQFETLAGELGAASARILEVNERFRQQLDEQYTTILRPARPAEPATATQAL